MWDYNPALSTQRDLVRYLVQDTLIADQLMQDEEIAAALSMNPNPRMAAAEIADRIALQFARRVTTRVGDTQVNYSDRAQQYSALARKLRQDAALRGAMPYAGGISVAEKQTYAAASDRVQPAFTRTMDDERMSIRDDA